METTDASFNSKQVELATYTDFLGSLIAGSRSQCQNIVEKCMGAQLPIRVLYEQLFCRSLYDVGELWEFNKISVATEHVATAITEGLMNYLLPRIISQARTKKKAVIASVENELHQVGAKMVADVFEMHGWDSFYLGANTPTSELVRFVREKSPDVVALSLSVYFNIGQLKKAIEILTHELDGLPVLVGGQAFRHGGESVVNKYSGVNYISGLEDLESWITGSAK
ncbi:MAG: cobalamin-dependent protein [Syntrophobacteraceae bacterium]